MYSHYQNLISYSLQITIREVLGVVKYEIFNKNSSLYSQHLYYISNLCHFTTLFNQQKTVKSVQVVLHDWIVTLTFLYLNIMIIEAIRGKFCTF
jgi:hypothetical protein